MNLKSKPFGRAIAGAVALMLTASSCLIPTTEETIARDGGLAVEAAPDSPTERSGPVSPDSENPPDERPTAARNQPFDTDGLPYSGPGLNSHWHAAYVVRVCDDVLDPFVGQDDPLGIHSHGDGLIHIHPFFSTSAWEQATFGHFTDAMGVELSEGRLVIPGVGEWNDGDDCGGVPGRVSVKRWAGPESTEPYEIITDDPAGARFLHDGELFTISFAPEGHLPVRPPNAPNLYEVSGSLGAGPPAPFVVLPDDADQSSASLWTIGGIDEGPCTTPAIPGRSLGSSEFCYSRGSLVIEPAQVETARAMWINNGPGVVFELAPQTVESLNEAIVNNIDSGGVRLAVEIEGHVVLTIALLRPLGDERLAFFGGMTPNQARSIADLFGGI